MVGYTKMVIFGRLVKVFCCVLFFAIWAIRRQMINITTQLGRAGSDKYYS